MQIAILAGGLATRLGKITENIPKSMVEVAGKPFIYWQLKNLKEKGFSKVVLCVRHYANKIEEYVKDGSQFGLEVKYSNDGDIALGTGGAIKKALPLLNEEFFVTYGDSYLDVNYKDILNSTTFDNLGLMAIYKNENELEPSNIILRNNQIVKYDKKTNSLEMTYIDYGLSIFRKAAFSPFKDSFDLFDVYTNLISIGRLGNYKVKDRFYEIGSEKGIKETEKYILKKTGG